MRTKIAAGNWKMNTNLEEGLQLSREIANAGIGNKSQLIILSVPYTHLKLIVDQTLHVPHLEVAAQNCHHQSSGAYTGEISCNMIASLGVPYVIIGHSERRQQFNESHDILKQKVDIALENNLKVIFCCGESLDIRRNKEHISYVKNQLEESLFHLSSAQLENIIIAYEPIWAIGTGETASPEQAQEMHYEIRVSLANNFGQEPANRCSILYGGSVKAQNAKTLFSQDDIDGGLVGGASLDAESFIEIIRSLS